MNNVVLRGVDVAGGEGEGAVGGDLNGVHGLGGDCASSEESREDGDDHFRLCVKNRKQGEERAEVIP